MSSWKRLGELMCDCGYVSTDQVSEALQLQQRHGEHRLLGQILVSRGYATAPQVQVALARQRTGGSAATTGS